MFALLSECLQNGGVVAYPTETLYGIGCSAFNREACRKVVDVKHRSAGKGLIVLVKDEEMMNEHFHIPQDLLHRYSGSGKSLTLVVKPASDFPEQVSGDRDSVAVRISPSPFVRKLFDHIEKPITSTSANISGRGNSNRFKDVARDFTGRIDVIVNSGNLPGSSGSTIVDVTMSPPVIIRQGDLRLNEIEEIING